jgi:hypothetical protein
MSDKMKEITQKSSDNTIISGYPKWLPKCVGLSNVVIHMSLSSFPHVPISNIHPFYVQDKC